MPHPPLALSFFFLQFGMQKGHGAFFAAETAFCMLLCNKGITDSDQTKILFCLNSWKQRKLVAALVKIVHGAHVAEKCLIPTLVSTNVVYVYPFDSCSMLDSPCNLHCQI